MALDKLVDSAQLDSDLGDIADAIRSKTGGSADLAFPAGFVSAVQAIDSLHREVVMHTPTENERTFTFTDPRPEKTPAFVTVELDEESYEGELVTMMHYSLFAPCLQDGILYSNFYRWPSWMRYYDANGALMLRNQGTGSGYAAGLSDPRGTICAPGYNSTYNQYKAGATYKITLYYWD